MGTAAAVSMASAGLSAGSALTKGYGSSEGQKYQAERLDEAARYGELQAEQTGGALSRQLAITLGNIDAVRAAAHTDPTSPTGVAVRDFNERMGLEQKGIQVSNLLQQSKQNTADAAYFRKSANMALLSGGIEAGASLTKAFGKSGTTPLTTTTVSG